LRRTRWFDGPFDETLRFRDISWLAPDGAELSPGQWEDPEARALMVRLDGRAPDSGLRAPASHTTLVILSNASSTAVTFTLPDGDGARWRVLADTVEPDSEAVFNGGAKIERCDRSLLLLGIFH